MAEGVRIAQAIEPYVDIIHVSAGTYQKTFGITHPSMFEDHGRNVFLAAEIKKHVHKPVATIGGLTDPEMMVEIIASGKADIVYMARQLLADPKPRGKSKRGGMMKLSTACAVSPAWPNGRPPRPAAARSIPHRPRTGRHGNQPAPQKKKVLVVGAALAASMRPIRQPAAAIRSSSVKKKQKSAAS